MGLGGSATNDGSCGMAAAFGVKFYNKQRNEFIPIGKTLINIISIDTSYINKNIKNIEFITMCDINNPMYCKNVQPMYLPHKKVQIGIL